jgi:histidyl-tRNA synthetase
MERLLMVLESRNLLPTIQDKPHLYLALLGQEAALAVFPLVIKLREAGWVVETDLLGRSLKSQLKAADKSGAVLVGMVGEDELKNHQVLIRRMATGEQETIDLNNIGVFMEDEFKQGMR